MAERWQPMKGERVRVRAGLAGTCRVQRAQARPAGALGAVIAPLWPGTGHSGREEGKVGTVVEVDADAEGTHDVLVLFDEPVTFGPLPAWAQRHDRMYYAPSELERAPD